MTSGLKALHDIDHAIAKARKNVSEVSRLPSRASTALAEVSRKQASAYNSIAKLRLEMIEEGQGGGELGYVDKQAIKLLAAHEKEEARLLAKAEDSLAKITALEEQRRAQEANVEKAVTAYDKAAEACQHKLVKDEGYIALLMGVETAETTTKRARAKHGLAQEQVEEKGAPYRNDPYFNYLKKRNYGTKKAKGWLLIKWFDGMIARKLKYRESALNYQRLIDIPKRLARHVQNLEVKEGAAQLILKTAEEKALISAGVTKLKKVSLSAQTKLDAIDAMLEQAEERHGALRASLSNISGGESGPYRQALEILANTLKRKDVPFLRRLAAQTVSYDDEQAIDRLIELSGHARNLEEDRKQSKRLLDKYQDNLKDLEKLRRKFKSRRYDAPSSQFPGGTFGGNLLGAILGQMLAGMLSGNDVWRQIKRTQRTVRRHSDSDFGGIDWGEAMRLPRSSKEQSRRGGSIFGSGSSRTRRPRAPKPRTGGGGFRTGGGF
ncbi:MAG: hypothetical protein V3U57_01810 [Robiginitomaculum sp.]